MPMSFNGTSLHSRSTPDTTATLPPREFLKREDNTASLNSVPKLVLTPPDEEVSSLDVKRVEIAFDDYDHNGNYVRARGLERGH